MFYCETCRAENQWPKSLRGRPDSFGNCEMCGVTSECYDVPSSWLDSDVDNNDVPIRETIPQCEVDGCKNPALKGRILCDPHAFPAEQRKSARRRAVEAQLAKVSGQDTEE